ncbi:MAG: hypothetical protein GXX01_08575 [Clostridiales bacterium]|nr:hypothetical protein [Clostridiales bacterium]
MNIELTALHWVYLTLILLIIINMIMKRDTSLVSIAGVFAIGLIATGSLYASVMGIFNSFILAITELMGTILIISVITGMSKVMLKTGVNEFMVYPFTKLIRTPSMSYWVIGILMMIISWFFWPSPAVALIGAVLLPAALRVKMPAIGVAMAMNLFGHGIALSGDFIIQGAPKLTADGAGIPVSDVISASIPLVIIMGVVTTIAAFLFLRNDMKKGTISTESRFELPGTKDAQIGSKNTDHIDLPKKAKVFFAVLIPVLFTADLVIMSVLKLQGGDATALIGGTSLIILVLLSMAAYKGKGLEKITSNLIEGLKFGFEVFGPVIPIAAFFYLGDMAIINLFGEILPESSNGLVNDLGIALANTVPLNNAISAVTSTIVGAITGLDGSGFSGITLAGSVARLFSTALGRGIATLTALGQIAAIWVGGGTIVPWAVIPAAAICGVSPFDLVRRNMKPVIIGLAVTTIAAIFFI